ncbi:MAG: sigma-E processing peptidase SpoIIGA [Clostridia bacterium]|nr:sigma-E processing peptidase SpoIIGA [Clostridia bacterium]
MEVYIEWALIENFLIDAAVLSLSRVLLKRKISLSRICLGAGLGAIFAVLFPLFALKQLPAFIVKFSVGALLSFAASIEKGGGRYLLNVLSFYGCSFLFSGGMFAIVGVFSLDLQSGNGYYLQKIPVGGGLAVFLLLFLFAWFFFQRIHKRRRLTTFIYRCKLTAYGIEKTENGFLDSGNRASVKGKPLCFISPDLAYELLGERTMTEEAEIVTVSGRKKIKVFQAEQLEIYYGDKPNIIKEVYLSPTKTLGTRDYKILLGVSVLSNG